MEKINYLRRSLSRIPIKVTIKSHRTDGGACRAPRSLSRRPVQWSQIYNNKMKKKTHLKKSIAWKVQCQKISFPHWNNNIFTTSDKNSQVFQILDKKLDEKHRTFKCLDEKRLDEKHLDEKHFTFRRKEFMNEWIMYQKPEYR